LVQNAIEKGLNEILDLNAHKYKHGRAFDLKLVDYYTEVADDIIYSYPIFSELNSYMINKLTTINISSVEDKKYYTFTYSC